MTTEVIPYWQRCQYWINLVSVGTQTSPHVIVPYREDLPGPRPQVRDGGGEVTHLVIVSITFTNSMLGQTVGEVEDDCQNAHDQEVSEVEIVEVTEMVEPTPSPEHPADH